MMSTNFYVMFIFVESCLFQMGLDMSCNLNDIEAMVYGDDDDDEGDLEAELAALTGESLSESNVPEKHSMQQSNLHFMCGLLKNVLCKGQCF